MSTLLVWRGKLQRFYASYSLYVIKGFQFLLGLLVFGLINFNIGYMETVSSVLCTVGLAVVCTLLPVLITVLAAAALVLLQLYTLSAPIAAVAFSVFFVMGVFYFRFTPKKAWLILLSVLAFGLKIPFVLPVALGLMGTPVWAVPAAFGVAAYYLVDLVKASSAALKNAGTDGMASSLTGFTKQYAGNKEMWLMIAAVIVGTLAVHAIRTRSVDHAWKIASASGAGICVIIASAGNLMLNGTISYVMIVLSAILGVGVGIVLEFLFFSVDYSRTENIQFEDDEYYYYVKAVPKIGMAAPEKKIKHITERQQDAETGNASEEKENRTGAELSGTGQNPGGRRGERINDKQNTEEILLTRSLSKELGLDVDQEESE